MAGHLSLLKYRLFRTSDDPRLHAAIELIEDIAREEPRRFDRYATFLADADLYCRGLRDTVRLDPVLALLEADGRSIDHALTARRAYRPALGGEVGRVVHIVGAPRSGTSFLYYWLAHSGRFAHVTCDSHHQWFAFRLHKTEKLPLSACDAAILEEDTKRLRMRDNLLLPSEAEFIWHRSMPCYERRQTHHYQLHDTLERDMALVRGTVLHHCAAQASRVFLSKSPFNSFRIPLLRQAFPGRTRFIHIRRSAEACAASIERNGFAFSLCGTDTLSASAAREHFEAHILANDADDFRRVSYEGLMSDASRLHDLRDWALGDV